MKEEMRESPAGGSQLKLFSQCQRKWAFKYLKGFKVKDVKEHLTYGSTIHEAQAEFYRHDFSTKHAKEKIKEMLGSKDAKTMNLKVKANKAFDEWEAKLGSYDRENCKVLEVEKEAFLILPNGYKMTVRRDGVLEDCLVDEVFIRDTKTTGWSLEGTIQNYMHSDQPILYIASATQEEPDWLSKLSGWRTDCIYNKQSVWKVERSPVTTFTRDEIISTMQSYAAMTSDMAFKINSVLLDNDPIGIHFYADRARCFDFFSSCPYLPFCHEIDTIDLPPSNFIVDDWLAEGAVLDTFKTVEE